MTVYLLNKKTSILFFSKLSRKCANFAEVIVLNKH